jgi:hypothetical protein
MTQEGDLVLVYMENNPTFFARIESITPDVKPDWFHVKMLVLQLPLMVATWILRRAYIDGDEFTMGGNPVRMVKVVSPEEDIMPESSTEEPEAPKEGPHKKVSTPPQEKGKVVSMFDRRKKDHSS